MNKDFLVFHQNVRGLRDKNNELFGSLLPELPHILCLTEHFLTNQEIICLTMDHYMLGAEFCRKTLKKGGTCIYVDETLNFSNINLKKFCIEQDIEACAVKINLLDTILYILSVYRSPNGNFRQFLKGIDNILNYLNKPNIEISMCGDCNAVVQGGVESARLCHHCYAVEQGGVEVASSATTVTPQVGGRGVIPPRLHLFML